jgi:hypothetical protein
MSAHSERLRSWVVVLACVALLAALTSCGSDSSPSVPDSIALRPGRQVIQLGGFSISSDPRFPPCTPTGEPRDGPSVDTLVNLVREGQEWVARSVDGMGDLEIRLREVGRSARGVTVQGSARGLALDANIHNLSRDVRARLNGATDSDSAHVEGETASPVSAFVGGRIAGTIRFSDSQGRTGTCSAVQWSMQPF